MKANNKKHTRELTLNRVKVMTIFHEPAIASLISNTNIDSAEAKGEAQL